MTSERSLAAATGAVLEVNSRRRAQWYAVGASFFGWTFDAFDFFVLTFLLTDVARAFGQSRPTVALQT